MTFVPTLRLPALAAAAAASIIAIATPARAGMEAALLIEADSGKVLFAENATQPWYPASLSKLMTVYVTLQAVREHRVTLDTLITFSARAASQAPSKIGFKPGTQVTIDNALKILMVKSANDIAVAIAEGVDGSVETFADDMMATSRRLGMTQSSWVNPNGLPADEQITSARDLGILARALIHDFPEYDMYWHIPAIQLGKRTMRNFNTLIGRYDGADGMKTGFICASGFNLVASATRNGKRLIAVVLGAPSSPYRAAKAAGLLERGFHRGPLSWLSPSLGTVDQLQPINAAPPDLRDEMCGPHRKRPAAEQADEENESSTSVLSGLPPGEKASTLLKDRPETVKTITVFIGAAKNAAENQFVAARSKLQKFVKGKAAAKGTQVAAPAAAPSPATDVSNPSWMSFANPAKAEPAPLTAAPDAKPSEPAATAAASHHPAKAKAKAKPKAKAKAKTAAVTPAAPAAKPATAKPSTAKTAASTSAKQ